MYVVNSKDLNINDILLLEETEHIPSGFCNIAMENGPFIDGLPIKNGDVL